MLKTYKNKYLESGFSLLEVLLGVGSICLIVGAGIYIHFKDTNATTTPYKANIIYNYQPRNMRYTLPAGWTAKDYPDKAWSFELMLDSPHQFTQPQQCPVDKADGGQESGCSTPKLSAADLTITDIPKPPNETIQQYMEEPQHYSTLASRQIGNQPTYCSKGSDARQAPSDLPVTIPEELYTENGSCFVVWQDEIYYFTVTITNPEDNAGLYALVGSIKFVQ